MPEKRKDRNVCFSSESKKAKELIHQRHNITPEAPKNFMNVKNMLQDDLNKFKKPSSDFEAMMNES